MAHYVSWDCDWPPEALIEWPRVSAAGRGVSLNSRHLGAGYATVLSAVRHVNHMGAGNLAYRELARSNRTLSSTFKAHRRRKPRLSRDFADKICVLFIFWRIREARTQAWDSRNPGLRKSGVLLLIGTILNRTSWKWYGLIFAWSDRHVSNYLYRSMCYVTKGMNV